MAQVKDPFGNLLGLVGIDSSNARRAMHRRTAQELALQNVQGTLDQMQDRQASEQTRTPAALPIKAPGPSPTSPFRRHR